MLKELLLITILVWISICTAKPDLKGGPAGWQSVGFHGRRGLDADHHAPKSGRNRGRSGTFEGDYAGSQAKGKVAGKNMKANKGSNRADGELGRDKANAVKKGNNFEADRNGKKAFAETNGRDQADKLQAGKYEYRGRIDKSKKTALAENQKGKGRYNANLVRDKGIARDIDRRELAKMRGLRRGSKKVQGQYKGSEIRGQYNRKSSGSYAAAQVPRKRLLGIGRQQKDRVAVQEQSRGGKRGEARGRMMRNKRPVYESSVNGRDNSASVISPGSGQRLATIKIDKYKNVSCENFDDRENGFVDARPGFGYYDKSLTIDVPKKGSGYEWPTCMEVKARFKIPPGIDMKDLAASLTILVQGCGRLYCGGQHTCLTLECFYKDLCGKPNARPSQKHKDPASWLLSQTTSDACKKPIGSSRDVDLVFHYCPDPSAEMTGKACKKDALSALAVASIEVQVDLYTVKKRPLTCSGKPAQLEKRACQRVLLDYSVKWKNIPDLSKPLKSGVSALRKAQCNLEQKGTCAGTKSGGLSSILNPFGSRNRGSSSRGSRTNSGGSRGRGGNGFDLFKSIG